MPSRTMNTLLADAKRILAKNEYSDLTVLQDHFFCEHQYHDPKQLGFATLYFEPDAWVNVETLTKLAALFETSQYVVGVFMNCTSDPKFAITFHGVDYGKLLDKKPSKKPKTKAKK